MLVFADEVKILVGPVCKIDALAIFAAGSAVVKTSVTVILKASEVASVLVNVNVGVNVAIFYLFFLVNDYAVASIVTDERAILRANDSSTINSANPGLEVFSLILVLVSESS